MFFVLSGGFLLRRSFSLWVFLRFFLIFTSSFSPSLHHRFIVSSLHIFVPIILILCSSFSFVMSFHFISLFMILLWEFFFFYLVFDIAFSFW